MGTVHCYTSITRSYLPKARVLAESVKRFHPNWHFTVVLADANDPALDVAVEPFDELMTLADLGVAHDPAWIFGHGVVELCTAVKSITLVKLQDRGAEKVIFLDPDIVLFGPLDETETLLDEYPIILTPHQLVPQTNLPDVLEHELYSMKYGVFNLGFLAVASHGQGRDFARWWRERLTRLCYDEVCNGMYTDQKWCDFVPVFFDQTYIQRHAGYNVSTWNLTRRDVAGSMDTGITVNGQPLVFYHFTSYDTGDGRVIISREHPDNTALAELWAWYDERVAEKGQAELVAAPWQYGTFSDGSRIEVDMRMAYRRIPELQKRFPNPFVTGEDSFLEWWTAEGRTIRLAM